MENVRRAINSGTHIMQVFIAVKAKITNEIYFHVGRKSSNVVYDKINRLNINLW